MYLGWLFALGTNCDTLVKSSDYFQHVVIRVVRSHLAIVVRLRAFWVSGFEEVRTYIYSHAYCGNVLIK